MADKTYNYILSSLGIFWSVQDINNIISLILLIISVINVIYTFLRSIYKHIKNKEYDKIDDDISSLDNSLRDIQDKINKEEK